MQMPLQRIHGLRVLTAVTHPLPLSPLMSYLAQVPVLDGSALGWCLEVQQAGLRHAPQRGSGQQVAKKALAVAVPITVGGWGGGAGRAEEANKWAR